jgi:hypothetical protein
VSEDGLLSFVDAWSVDVEAPPGIVWEALLVSGPAAGNGLGRRLWARVLGCDPRDSNGLAPHRIGAERPGFAVCESVAPATYALAGRHRFARYQLVFRISQRGGAGSRLTAETFASFPGIPGRLYRTIVIDAKPHALVMWITVRLLRRRAERLARRQDARSA